MLLQNLRVIPIIGSFVDSILIPFIRHAQSYLQSLQRPSVLRADVAQSQKRTIATRLTTIPQRMPNNAWDCHMHVTSPEYPLASNAAYTPSLHNLQHAMSFEKTIGISNIVLVQPSIYGNDNSCLLDALKALGPAQGRGVVEVDPDTIELSTLEEWHQLGVRGVRLNLKSRDAQFTEAALEDTLKRYAAVVKPLDWVLELFIGMEALPILERVAGDLGVRLCLAHFGAPKLPNPGKATYPLDPYELTGFDSLVRLLQGGNTWLKLSAAYRFDTDSEMRGVEAVAYELLKKAGSQIVFASDWPHTRFDGLDVRPFVDRCLQWTEAAGLTEEVFCRNAQVLWDVKQ
ncbi:hypothetical protein BU24DRAFT_469646 [Aaosphaeria arxii CBS 175.79]|uniref:Amidohydrolase-related domain-containing protein n=1 Tax=Aaosphaeria arxii CBS 175.79 TaxID=1450172 RepID=A0A6A5Y5M6_9PLEO|nr:uncharacterized protein BU24DRAFT_469646 [Aaosphaeria arxii CBS 175.79]KAF2020855.1 hypothetical protein BU24DRAFT_469646 [Aaosphaeria arxii CBS 175.79]